MKILVTGGTGVIGAAAIPALLRAGHQVRLLSRHAERDVANWPEGVEAFAADIANPEPLREAVAGCEGVLHIAGIVEERPPEVTFEKVNVEGTRALCEFAAAGGAPFFLYISSLGAERGESEYQRSKFRAEEHVRRYAGGWLILRPGNVYGPGDETISMLLKMTRTLPSVPVVDEGEQPFQPLWYNDLGEAIARAFSRPELAGRTLELAGPDVTTTADVLARLSTITQRNPAAVPIPAWVARLGTSAVEGFGAFGRKLLSRAGLSAPINSSKLQMLLEENVIENVSGNALVSVFGVAPTSLQEGLELLADMLPEQLPGEGVGAVQRTIYAADIVGSKYDAEELIDYVCANFAEIMPLEFAAEPGAPRGGIEQGTTLTGTLPGRGNIQVRLEERTECSATFVTIEGHPLAGVLTFAAESVRGGVHFAVEIAAQPADAFDWVAMRALGGLLQARNWRDLVTRVVEATGGSAPAGVQRQREQLTPEDTERLRACVREMVAARKRQEAERALGAPAA